MEIFIGYNSGWYRELSKAWLSKIAINFAFVLPLLFVLKVSTDLTFFVFFV